MLEESFAPADVVLAELFVPADVVLAELFAPADVNFQEDCFFALLPLSETLNLIHLINKYHRRPIIMPKQ